MATCRQVCDSRHLQADCQERDQLRNPTLGTRVWATFTFYSAPPDTGEQSIVMSVSVCLSVCRFVGLSLSARLSLDSGTLFPNFTSFSCVLSFFLTALQHVFHLYFRISG